MAGTGESGPGARALRPGERVPPHSEDAERAVLGCALQDAARILDLCIERQIAPESFYVRRHQCLYEAMLALHAERKPVDFVTVVDRLRETQLLDGVGGEEELARLIDGTPTTAHAEYYVQRVYENHLLRRIIDAARAVTEDCYRGEAEAEALLNEAEAAFFGLGERKVGVERTWKQLIDQEAVEVEDGKRRQVERRGARREGRACPQEDGHRGQRHRDGDARDHQ